MVWELETHCSERIRQGLKGNFEGFRKAWEVQEGLGEFERFGNACLYAW
jgi:hypothetical protein